MAEQIRNPFFVDSRTPDDAVIALVRDWLQSAAMQGQAQIDIEQLRQAVPETRMLSVGLIAYIMQQLGGELLSR